MLHYFGEPGFADRRTSATVKAMSATRLTDAPETRASLCWRVFPGSAKNRRRQYEHPSAHVGEESPRGQRRVPGARITSRMLTFRRPMRRVTGSPENSHLCARVTARDSPFPAWAPETDHLALNEASAGHWTKASG
ncbi:hypothetical protein C0Z16_12850 [Paraburkholderia rhynchosiae]|uniref:Uncharacterized protein n=1 Tax=Paraburkholderia rhynchosiae TaxID=487049 RepID=A0ABX4V9H7_9BURK|nr:hypothetical protein C0Z16_12850 [Paraburkholderia rhynchosiae]